MTKFSRDDEAVPGVSRRTFHAFLGLIAGGASQALGQEKSQVAAPETEFQKKAEQYLREKVQDLAGPGLSISVRKHGRELVRCARGMSDLDQRTEIGPGTTFHLASVTKQFTAFAIFLLAARSKLDISNTIQTYFPELPNADKIKVTDLIYHMAGLRDQLTLLRLSNKSFEDFVSQDHMLQLSYRQRGLNFQPGTDFSYCNSGYTLLAEIVRIVSGISLRQFLAENVFLPFGMKDTFINDERGRIIPGRARSFAKNKDGTWRNMVLNYQWWGPTSLQSTPSDLTLWGCNLLDPPAELAAAFKSLCTPGRLRDGRELAYGGGLQINSVLGTGAFFHGGVDAAFRTHVLHIPSEQISVAVLANTPMAVQQIATDLADICLQPKTKAVPKKIAAEGAKPDTLVGTYAAASGNLLIVEEQEGKLTIRLPGLSDEPAPSRKLIFRDDGSFDTGFPDAITFRVTQSRAGIASRIEEVAGISGIPFGYQRVGASNANVPPMKMYEGSYYSDEVDCSYEIVAEEGGLIARAIGGEPIRFRQFATDRFTSDSWQFTTLGFERNGKNKVLGFMASSIRAIDVKFTKRPTRE
jgi:CubicO group peptidase (beta-lactamase class C family)